MKGSELLTSSRLSNVMASLGNEWAPKNGGADGGAVATPAAMLRRPSTLPLAPQAGTRAAREADKFETGSSLIFQQNQLKVGKKAVDVHVDLHAEIVAPVARTPEEYSILHSHHTLPVFASGRAFVPSAIDNILSNSFFDAFAPLMCERLLCGQKTKAMFQIDLPMAFVGRPFIDLYRALASKSVHVIALYRSPDDSDGTAILPYVYTCPARDAVLRARDRAFVYCHPLELDYALHVTHGFSTVLGPADAPYLAENTAAYVASKDKYRSADLRTRDYAVRQHAQQQQQQQQQQPADGAPRTLPRQRSAEFTAAGIKVPDTVHEHDEHDDDGSDDGHAGGGAARKEADKPAASDGDGMMVESVAPSPETSGRVGSDAHRWEQKRELSPSSSGSAAAVDLHKATKNA